MKRLFTALSLAALCACSADDTEFVTPIPEQPESIADGITFSAADGFSKTRIDINGTSVVWRAGDAIGIFSPQITDAANYKAEISTDNDGAQNAALITTLQYSTGTEHTFYAYYPYSEQADATNATSWIAGEIPTSQDGTFGANAFMYATTTVTPSSEPVALTFKHPFTYLDIQLRAVGQYKGAKVKEITVSTVNKILAGEFVLLAAKDEIHFISSASAITSTSSVTSLSEEYQDSFIVVNSADLTGTELSVTVTLEIEGKEISFKVKKAGRQLKPQTKTNIKITVEEEIGDIIDFADSKVKEICVANWDTNSDGELSTAEAAAVTSLNNKFYLNEEITNFDELRYFTGLKRIGGFYGCNNLTSVILPNGVITIDTYAFQNCYKLKSVTIPASVKNIFSDAFYGCENLDNVYIEDIDAWCRISSDHPKGNKLYLNGTLVTHVTFPSDVTTVSVGVFEGYKHLTTVKLHDNISKIEAKAFSRTGITSITIPKSVVEIGREAFAGSSLAEVVFANGSQLKTIHGGYADMDTSESYGAFMNCPITSIAIPAGVEEIPATTFEDCTKLQTVTFASGSKLKTIGGGHTTDSGYGPYTYGAFERCTALTSIVIPTSVTTIEAAAFSGCTSLASVTFEDGSQLTTIGDNICSYYENDSPFYGCAFKTFTIPKGVTEMSAYAFAGCRNLTTLYCEPTIPPNFGGYSAPNLFYVTPVIYVSLENILDYKAAAGWSRYTDKITWYNF